MMARQAETPSRLSHVTAAISGVLVLLLAGYLTLEAIRPDPPPAIIVEVVSSDGWVHDGTRYVPLDVRNGGGRPAKDVAVGATLDDRPAGELLIDFLAGGESRRVYLALPAGSATDGLEVHVIGYEEP